MKDLRDLKDLTIHVRPSLDQHTRHLGESASLLSLQVLEGP